MGGWRRYNIYMMLQLVDVPGSNAYIRGPPLDIWGEGLEFWPGHFYLLHKRCGKLEFFFTPG